MKVYVKKTPRTDGARLVLGRGRNLDGKELMRAETQRRVSISWYQDHYEAYVRLNGDGGRVTHLVGGPTSKGDYVAIVAWLTHAGVPRDVPVLINE